MHRLQKFRAAMLTVAGGTRANRAKGFHALRPQKVRWTPCHMISGIRGETKAGAVIVDRLRRP